jgi:hypothetical protein
MIPHPVRVRAGVEVAASPRLVFKLTYFDEQSRKMLTKKRGRPATGTSPVIGVRVHADLKARIDEWRAEQRPLPSQPEAIRRLVEQALDFPPKKKA